MQWKPPRSYYNLKGWATAVVVKWRPFPVIPPVTAVLILSSFTSPVQDIVNQVPAYKPISHPPLDVLFVCATTWSADSRPCRQRDPTADAGRKPGIPPREDGNVGKIIDQA